MRPPNAPGCGSRRRRSAPRPRRRRRCPRPRPRCCTHPGRRPRAWRSRRARRRTSACGPGCDRWRHPSAPTPSRVAVEVDRELEADSVSARIRDRLVGAEHAGVRDRPHLGAVVGAVVAQPAGDRVAVTVDVDARVVGVSAGVREPGPVPEDPVHVTRAAHDPVVGVVDPDDHGVSRLVDRDVGIGVLVAGGRQGLRRSEHAGLRERPDLDAPVASVVALPGDDAVAVVVDADARVDRILAGSGERHDRAEYPGIGHRAGLDALVETVATLPREDGVAIQGDRHRRVVGVLAGGREVDRDRPSGRSRRGHDQRREGEGERRGGSRRRGPSAALGDVMVVEHGAPLCVGSCVGLRALRPRAAAQRWPLAANLQSYASSGASPIQPAERSRALHAWNEPPACLTTRCFARIAATDAARGSRWKHVCREPGRLLAWKGKSVARAHSNCCCHARLSHKWIARRDRDSRRASVRSKGFVDVVEAEVGRDETGLHLAAGTHATASGGSASPGASRVLSPMGEGGTGPREQPCGWDAGRC